MDDNDSGYDPGSWDLGINWDEFGTPYDGGTLDAVEVVATVDPNDGYGDWTGDTSFGDQYIDWDYYGGIGDPLDDIYNVYLPDDPNAPKPPTTPRPTQQNPATRPPTSGSSPGGTSSGIQSQPKPASATDAIKGVLDLFNKVFAAVKPPTTAVQPNGTTQPVADTGFPVGGLVLMVGAAIGITYLIVRKK